MPDVFVAAIGTSMRCRRKAETYEALLWYVVVNFLDKLRDRWMPDPQGFEVPCRSWPILTNRNPSSASADAESCPLFPCPSQSKLTYE